MIKAIIFDFDGLIIDTETAWYEAYRDVFREYGVHLPLDLWCKVIGSNFDAFDPFQYLEEQSGRKVEKAAIIAQTKQIHDQMMQKQGLRDGVKQYLEAAKSRGLKTAIASSSNRTWIHRFVDIHQLADYFDQITTADDVVNVKPDPELYIKTMHDLNVNGNETLVFEDSLNGLRAAKSAGAYCCIVPNEVTKALDFENYDLRISSMGEKLLDEVIRIIENKGVNS